VPTLVVFSVKFMENIISTEYLVRLKSKTVSCHYTTISSIQKILYWHWKSPLQQDLVYELIGVYPAQDYFIVNPTNGQVSLKASLTTDSLQLLDYTVSIAIMLKLFCIRD